METEKSNFLETIRLLGDQVAQIEVQTEEQFRAANELRLLCVAQINQIEEFTRPNIKRLDQAHKAAVQEEKSLTVPLLGYIAQIKKKQIAWEVAEKQRRELEAAKEAARKREEEERARLELAEELEKAGATDTALEVISEPIKVNIVPEKMAKVEGFRHRTVWKFRIVDETLLPKQYLMPNEAFIRADVIRLKEACAIPGVEVYSEEV